MRQTKLRTFFAGVLRALHRNKSFPRTPAPPLHTVFWRSFLVFWQTFKKKRFALGRANRGSPLRATMQNHFWCSKKNALRCEPYCSIAPFWRGSRLLHVRSSSCVTLPGGHVRSSSCVTLKILVAWLFFCIEKVVI